MASASGKGVIAGSNRHKTCRHWYVARLNRKVLSSPAKLRSMQSAAEYSVQGRHAMRCMQGSCRHVQETSERELRVSKVCSETVKANNSPRHGSGARGMQGGVCKDCKFAG